MAQKIIFYEMNEVPLKVFNHYCKNFPKSAFARLRDRADIFETVAEDSGHLSPWVTWPTLHRGVTNDVHEITDFGQNLTAIDKEAPPIWEMLARNGVKVGMFGSLHTYPMPQDMSNYAFYVPDTFAAGPECFPKKFESFQNFNLAMAGKNASQVNSGIALKEASRFLRAAPGLGLSGRTVSKLVSQLASERFDRKRVVRRRTSQVQIAFDFFLRSLRQDRPDASFFFTNHVASSLHRYWPSLFPDDYDILSYDEEWLKAWKDEIPFTLHEANYQLSQLMEFADASEDFKIVVVTSMGQAAVQGKERIERKVIFTGLRSLMQGLGLGDEDWQKRPAMVPQYIVYVAPASRNMFMQNVGALSICGKGLTVEPLGEGVYRMEFSMVNMPAIEVFYQGERVDPKKFGIVNVDLQDAAGANAYHIPEGMMAVYDPKKASSKNVNRISTLEVTPSVLANFGIKSPAYMQRGFTI